MRRQCVAAQPVGGRAPPADQRSTRCRASPAPQHTLDLLTHTVPASPAQARHGRSRSGRVGPLAGIDLGQGQRARTWAVHGGRCSKPPGYCSTSRREGPAGAGPWPGRRAARGPPALAWLTIAPQLTEVGRRALPAADDDGRVAVPGGRLQSPSRSWVFGGTPARRLRGGGLPAPTLGLPCTSSRPRSLAGVRLTPLPGRAPLSGCLSAHREPDRAGGDVRRAARTVLLGQRFLWTGSMRSPQSPLCGVAPGCPRVVVVVPVEPPRCWRPRALASRFGRVRKLPSGRWQARYTLRDATSRSAPATCATKTAAERWLSATETDLLRGQWSDPRHAQVPLADYAVRWLQGRGELKVRTRELYGWLLEKYLLPQLGDVPLSNLTSAEVRSWHAGMQRTAPPTPTSCVYGGRGPPRGKGRLGRRG